MGAALAEDLGDLLADAAARAGDDGNLAAQVELVAWHAVLRSRARRPPPILPQRRRDGLAQTLRGVVSQRLIRRKGGAGRIVACEVMTVSQLIRDYILDPLRIKEISDLIKKGTAAEGMIGFDQHLLQLVRAGQVDEETALQYASSHTDLKLKLGGF